MGASIETWGMTQFADPAFRATLAKDPESVIGLVHLEMADGVIEVDKRMALFNLFLFPILLEFNITPAKRHFIRYRAITADSMAKDLQIYYDEIMGLDVHHAKRLKMAIWRMLQELYMFSSERLLSFISTIDVMDMAEIMDDEPMRKIQATKSKIIPEVGTDVIEKHIDTQNKKIMALFKERGGLKNDALYTYSICGQLNKFQIPQTVYAFGVRTDVSDNIIGYPVRGSALDGLENISEFAAESLSAKKSAFYNHMAVAGSQYFGRKQALLVSSVRYLYHGDCGSTALVRFNVTEKNYENLVGKMIYVEGQPVILSRSNLKHFIGTTIYMRSPMTCRYRKGVCEVCGGKVMANVNRRLNGGMLGAVHVIEPTTQKILSAKHLIKTKSIVYILPKQASEVLFLSSTNEIRWRPEFAERLPKLMIGIPQEACPNIYDVLALRADKQPKEERFSEIKYFSLRDNNGKEATYTLESSDQVPFFSADMLLHIRDHFNEVVTDEKMVWIPLKATEKFPIFKTIVMNDNMLQFVSRVSKFLSDDIKNYTSCSEALQDFSNTIHDKVSANIAHLEILLKAYQISSEYDYRVPRVDDPEHVMFQTTAAILNNRHVGTKLAFQGLTQYLTLPSTYLLPRMASCFDPMVGY